MRAAIPSQSDYVAGLLGAIPDAWRGRVTRQHDKKIDNGPPEAYWASVRAANQWLRDTVESVAAIRIPLTASDAELCDLAKLKASECMSVGGAVPRSVADIRAAMSQFVAGYGIEPPGPKIEDRPAIRRMTAPLWWRLKLRRAQTRAVELAAIRLGYIHKRDQIYASNETTRRRAQQKRRNAAGLEATTARNLDTGQSFSLAELAARSVANPVIRRGELMTRIRGFDEVARGVDGVGGVGDVAEFWTATCPSRMHAKTALESGAVIDNPRYDGTTPRDAQRYLARCWARFRAFVHRRGIAVYGFRVAEPHHDGTPHWHLLTFFRPWLSPGRALMPRMRAWFRRYFLADSSAEQGAKLRRCTFKAIRPGESAAGYVAKYISKNIDGGGYQVQGDIEGGANDAYTPSHRVEAWATAWGIRQFQQIGGPPVGIWRELRRLDETQNDVIEAARVAADAGDWRAYCAAIGMKKSVLRVELIGRQADRWSKPNNYGTIRPLPSRLTWKVRMHWPVELAKTRAGSKWNHAAGCDEPACLTAYGEEAPPAVYGVKQVQPTMGRRAADLAYPSRRYSWDIRRGGVCLENGSIGALGAGIGGAPGAGSGDAQGAGGKGFDLGRPAEPAAPWTRVNNCTQGEESEGENMPATKRAERANKVARGIIAQNVRELRAAGLNEAADQVERAAQEGATNGIEGTGRDARGNSATSAQAAGRLHDSGADPGLNPGSSGIVGSGGGENRATRGGAEPWPCVR